MRALISITLSIESGIRVVGEAADGTEALARYRELRPDAVVLDMRMPGLSGLDVARELLGQDPQLTIVMCSAFMDEQDRAEAGGLGVAAHVDKLHIAKLGGVISAAHDVRGSRTL